MTRTHIRSSARLLTLAALVGLAGLAPVAIASGSDDFPPGTVLPAADQVIGFQAAASTTTGTFPGAVITRVKFELENGQIVYRTEGVHPMRRARVRQDINPITGAILRSRSQTINVREARDAATIGQAMNTFTVNFSQAAQIAVQSRGAGQATDVRVDGTSRGLTYKVTVLNGATKAEVRINPVTGAVLSTSVDDNGGASGGNGGGNSGGNGGGNSGGNGGSNNPVPAALGNGARAISNAIANALANQPAGTLVVEADLKRERGARLEVKTIAPDAANAIEFRANPGTGAIIRSESEGLDAGDAALVAAFRTALGTSTPLTHADAMARALTVARGDVSAIEIGMQGGQPMYEVKVTLGARSRSIKVHAVTGAIL